MKAKKINCLICQKECFSGKRNLCDYHYNLELKEKEKAKLKKLKTKEKALLVFLQATGVCSGVHCVPR